MTGAIFKRLQAFQFLELMQYFTTAVRRITYSTVVDLWIFRRRIDWKPKEPKRGGHKH